MIKNYKQFESLLDKLKGPTDDEILNYLKTLNDSDRIKKIINNKLNYKYLPKKLIVDDNFDCSGKQLTTLPDNLTINGWLNCVRNQLTTLPDNLIVNGWIDCRDNQLTSLPDNLTINGGIDCRYNQLTNLPENLTVNGGLYCSDNLKELEIPSSAKIKGKVYR